MGKRIDKLNIKIESEELSMYDAMMAEIMDERMARKDLRRKHRAGQQYRHRKPDDRHAKLNRFSMVCQHEECGNSYARNFHAEKSIRSDWELERVEEIDAMWTARKVAMNEWLKYA